MKKNKSQQNVTKFPEWKQAILKLFEENYKDGDVIEHSWFYDAFGIEKPDDDTPSSEAEKAKLQYLTHIEALKDELLQNHQIHLKNVYGVGYRILHPKEHAKNAITIWDKKKNKLIKKTTDRFNNINYTKLTPEERKEAITTASGFIMQAGFLKKRDIGGMISNYLKQNKLEKK